MELDAQTHSVETHVERCGGTIARVSQIETGNRNGRPQLQQAMALCRQKKATLVIAKLIESRVDFVACDMPQANTLTLHIIAAMAQHEREAICNRIKEALTITKNTGYDPRQSPTRYSQAQPRPAD